MRLRLAVHASPLLLASVFAAGVAAGRVAPRPLQAIPAASAGPPASSRVQTKAPIGQPATSVPTAGSLVVQNIYFPRPGMEAEVLATRLEASRVRAGLGLETGRVLRRIDGPEDGPFVMWEAEYADQAAREADVAALDGTDFERVSGHMGTLLDRFGRTVWEVVEPEDR